jgi:hypothetical protein
VELLFRLTNFTLGSDRCPSPTGPGSEQVDLGFNPVCREIAPTEIESLREQALAGSIDAARKLAWHFGSKQDWDQQYYWLAIAIENGDLDMRLMLAASLSNNPADRLKRIRGHYWYRRVIHDGPPDQAERARQELAAWEKYDKLMNRSVP